LTLSVSDELKDFVAKASSDKNLKVLLDGIDKEILKSIKEGGNIVLNPKKTRSLYYRKQDFQKYAMPYAVKAFPYFTLLEILRRMDISTASGFINQLVTVTVGNDNFPATNAQLKKIAELFANPSKSLALIYNHTLEVKFHRPEINVLGDEKYEPAVNGIKRGLRLPLFLIDGTGSNYATAVVASKPIVARIKQATNDLKVQWLIPIYKRIAEAMGFDEYPEPYFGENVLEDEKTKILIMSALRDRGLISAKTSIEKYAGLNSEQEISNMEDEQKLVLAGIIGDPTSTYQSNYRDEGDVSSPEGTAEVVDEKQAKKDKKKKANTGTTGRPGDKISDYPDDREAAPAKGE